MSRIGIVVPTANPDRYPAQRCIAALKATTGHLDVDLQIVVSSGPDFRLSRSVNKGWAATGKADYYVLMNDDAFVDAGWLDAFLEAAKRHPEVGVWGALLRYEKGGIQHAGARITLDPLDYFAAATARMAPFWALRELAKHRFQARPYMFDHYNSPSPKHRLDFVTGAVEMISCACFEKIGGYDEDYYFGSEDVDYALRALEAGFELGMAYRATSIHLDRGTGAGLKDRAALSDALFRERWSADRIRKATRGRIGVHVE